MKPEYERVAPGADQHAVGGPRTGSVGMPVDREEAARQREYRTLLQKFWMSAAVSVPVVLLSYPWLVPGLKGVGWLARGSDGLLWVWRGLGLVTLPVLL